MYYKFGEFNYYKVLGLRNATKGDKKRNITDDIVKEAYLDRKRQLEAISKKVKSEGEMLEIKLLEEILKDSYQVLHTAEGREQFDSLLKKFETARKEHKLEKEIKRNIPKRLVKSKDTKKISKEEYEKKEEFFKRAMKATQNAARIMEEKDKIKYMPIHEGKIVKNTQETKKDETER